jgi:opacity protein-like surface antigen
MDIGGGELHLSGARVQPYILAGIGTVRLSAKVAIAYLKATETTYHFSSSLGGGVRVFATRNVDSRPR